MRPTLFALLLVGAAAARGPSSGLARFDPRGLARFDPLRLLRLGAHEPEEASVAPAIVLKLGRSGSLERRGAGSEIFALIMSCTCTPRLAAALQIPVLLAARVFSVAAWPLGIGLHAQVRPLQPRQHKLCPPPIALHSASRPRGERLTLLRHAGGLGLPVHIALWRPRGPRSRRGAFSRGAACPEHQRPARASSHNHHAHRLGLPAALLARSFLPPHARRVPFVSHILPDY